MFKSFAIANGRSYPARNVPDWPYDNNSEPRTEHRWLIWEQRYREELYVKLGIFTGNRDE